MEKRQELHKALDGILSVILAITLVMSLQMPSLAYASEAEAGGGISASSVEAGSTLSGDEEIDITESGTYYVTAGMSGDINIAANLEVTLVGTDFSDDTSQAEDLAISSSIECGENVELTLQDISQSTAKEDSINFTAGEENVLTIEGTCLLDHDNNDIYSVIHVPSGTALTINGGGTAYIYKSSRGAGIGGNNAELNGAITFGDADSSDGDSLTIFMKGSKTGAVIGTGGTSGTLDETPADITFNSGDYYLIANARGALIGGSAGTTGQKGGNVYINGGSLNLNVDYSGAAIGGGGYDAGNDAEGGNVFIDGGSIRTFIDTNAVDSWSSYGVTEAGVNDAAITATKTNSENGVVTDSDGESVDTVAYMAVDVSSLIEAGADDFSVTVDGQDYDVGSYHVYRYVNEDYEKDYQSDITSTFQNWVEGYDTNLYLYASMYEDSSMEEPATHTVTVNGTLSCTYTWDEESEAFVLAEEGSEEESGDIVVSTAEELAAVAATVNGGDSLEGVTVTLANDIDLSDYGEWTPIGDATTAFAGTFDGAGYSITGLSITSAASGYSGLFGNNSGTIQDLSVSGTITLSSGSDNIGGVVGYNSGTVRGVTSSVAVSVSTSSIYAVGGVVGQNAQGGLITECANTGDITGVKCTGGICGRSYGDITYCCNSGDVAGTGGGKDSIGGVLGQAGDKDSTYETTVTACYNLGTISNPDGRWYGGIVGMADSGVTLTDCYNAGAIDDEGYSWNWNPIIGHVDSAYSSVTNNYSLAGGAYGDKDESTIPVTVGTQLTADEFKTAAKLLNSTEEAIYSDDECSEDACYANGGFPILYWQELEGAEHDWDYEDISWTWADDYSSASASYACGVCGTSASVEASVSSVATDAACEVGGSVVYTATATIEGVVYSDEQSVEVEAATGHSLVETAEVAATCTSDGTAAYWTCSVCGKMFSDAEGTTEITEPVAIAATGHSFTNYVSNGDATCTADGTKTASCDNGCGETDTVADEGSALGHDYESIVTDPTCTEAGCTTWTCTRCGDSYTSDETAALGHDYAGTVTTEATCTTAGVMTYTCSRCGDSYTEEIPATGHSAGEAVVENEVAATCTTAGSYDIVVYCSVCGEEISRTSISVDATGHSWGEGVVTAPTCTEGGFTTYTCTVCGESYSDSETEATGHDYAASWTWSDDCSSATLALSCSVCGDAQSVVASVTSSTAEDGSTVYTATASFGGIEYSDSQTVAAAEEEEGGDEGTGGEESTEPEADEGEGGDEGTGGEESTEPEADSGEGGDESTEPEADSGTGEEDATEPEADSGEAEGGDEGAEEESGYFTDVMDESKYYYEAVYALAGEGYVTGVSDTLYGVGQTMTRAQFATIMWRIAEPEAYAAYANDADNATSFADVSDGLYYTAAVNWAVENEVMKGYSDTRFAPNKTISFEEMCLVIARFANDGDTNLQAAVSDDAAAEILAGFADADEVSSWADNGMAWCVDAGLVTGNTDTTIVPDEDVSRERAAVVIARWLDLAD